MSTGTPKKTFAFVIENTAETEKTLSVTKALLPLLKIFKLLVR